MSAPNRIEVAADVSRNRLLLAFVGTITPKEMEIYVSHIERALASLHPGFSLMSDFTALTKMELSCVPLLERTMDSMKTHGIGLVVRIIPDQSKDIGMNIMSLFHYPHGLKIITTPDRNQGLKLLD